MLDNFLSFQFSGIKNVFCLFHGKNHNTAASLGSIAFNHGESNEKILANRKFLYEKLAMPIMEVHQIHSNILHFSPQPILYNENAILEGDGIATNIPKHALLIKTADCQPILLTHKKGKYIMALHVGWRGNRNEFIEKAVDSFCNTYNLSPKDLLAVRGPSLGSREAEFIKFSEEWNNGFKPWYNEEEKKLNLWDITRHQLKKAGLSQENIYGIDCCTKTMHNQYFSHRQNNHTGRQASLIWFE